MVVVNLDELSETYALPGVPPSPPSLGQVQTSQRWVVEGRRDSANPGGNRLESLGSQFHWPVIIRTQRSKSPFKGLETPPEYAPDVPLHETKESSTCRNQSLAHNI